MRLASVVAYLLKRLEMLETAADQHTEVLEESCIHLSVEYQHEKKKKASLNILLVFPLFWKAVVKQASGRGWRGCPLSMSIHSREWTDGCLAETRGGILNNS